MRASPAMRASPWRELLPKEHGSWAFAFEPLALGLLVAPTPAGAALALALAAAFFCRRPLRFALEQAPAVRNPAARPAVAACGAAAALALAGAIATGGAGFLAWLLPSALAGALFLRFDLQKAGREGVAELAGVAAFAFVPAALLAIAGRSPAEAFAAAGLMLGRALPTVLCIRASLRAAKGGSLHPVPAVAAAVVALAAGVELARTGLVSLAAVGPLALLTLRTIVLLVHPRPAWQARTLGMIEAALGLCFVGVTAATWPR